MSKMTAALLKSYREALLKSYREASMTHTPKYQVGEHVASTHSGKIYIVRECWPLDEHGCFAYSVRGWRGGKLYGPTRTISESALCKHGAEPFDYDESKMFPFGGGTD